MKYDITFNCKGWVVPEYSGETSQDVPEQISVTNSYSYFAYVILIADSFGEAEEKASELIAPFIKAGIPKQTIFLKRT